MYVQSTMHSVYGLRIKLHRRSNRVALIEFSLAIFILLTKHVLFTYSTFNFIF